MTTCLPTSSELGKWLILKYVHEHVLLFRALCAFKGWLKETFELSLNFCGHDMQHWGLWVYTVVLEQSGRNRSFKYFTWLWWQLQLTNIPITWIGSGTHCWHWLWFVFVKLILTMLHTFSMLDDSIWFQSCDFVLWMFLSSALYRRSLVLCGMLVELEQGLFVWEPSCFVYVPIFPYYILFFAAWLLAVACTKYLFHVVILLYGCLEDGEPIFMLHSVWQRSMVVHRYVPFLLIYILFCPIPRHIQSLLLCF